VDLVDDVDLVLAAEGPVDAVGDQVSGVIDRVVGCGVDLDKRRCPAPHDRGVDIFAAPVKGLAKIAGHGSLSHAAGAGEEISSATNAPP
jgi:hypothetical protein